MGTVQSLHIIIARYAVLVSLYYAQFQLFNIIIMMTNTFRCEGSLIIDLGDFGTTEVCGQTLNVSGSSYLNQHPQSLRILFRTGEFEHTSDEETRGKGFQMYVICFKDEPLEGKMSLYSPYYV